jgi:hypothetical protein
MLTLGVSRTRRDAGRYKPYPKQDVAGYPLFSTELAHLNRLRILVTRSLEE